MQKLLPLVTAAALVLTSSACIVTSRPGHGRSHQASRAKCHPSQYWDGDRCRHKGKGHGARKHDGR